VARALLIGDSIRMAYAGGVAQGLRGLVDIVEIPENGGDSANLLAKAPGWLDAVDPDTIDIAHVNCGLHDIKRPFASAERQVDLSAYTVNVRAILSLVRERVGGQVIWASSTPVVYERHHVRKGFDRFDADVIEYNAAADAVARELGVATHDLYAAIAEDGVAECVGADGVHMTLRGNDLLVDRVAERLRAALATPAPTA
jgi:lysophospholipase L1-like esterase